MVLLTMTPAIVAAVNEYNDSATPEKSHVEEADVVVDLKEPTLESPALGRPISHGQIVDISRRLRSSNSTSSRVQYNLETLLRGSRVYSAPPVPKKEPVKFPLLPSSLFPY
jgi:TMEM199 family protein